MLIYLNCKIFDTSNTFHQLVLNVCIRNHFNIPNQVQESYKAFNCAYNLVAKLAYRWPFIYNVIREMMVHQTSGSVKSE